MSGIPLPSPRDPRHDRFADATGRNRFSDDEPVAPASPTNNPYAPSLTPGGPPEQIAQFETTQTSRGPLLLGLSGVGWLGLIMAAANWLRNSGWGLPSGLIAAVLGVTSLWLAYSDLGAMRAGAMEPSGKNKSETAFWLSVVQILLLCGLTAVFLWQLFQPEEV